MWLFEDQWQLTGQFFSLIDFALSAIHVCHCISIFAGSTPEMSDGDLFVFGGGSAESNDNTTVVRRTMHLIG